MTNQGLLIRVHMKKGRSGLDGVHYLGKDLKTWILEYMVYSII